MDLGTLAVILGFSPDKLRVGEIFQRLSAPCALDGLWDLEVYEDPDRRGLFSIHNRDTGRLLT